MTVSVRLVLIDAAPTHSSPIPGQSFVDRHERAKGVTLNTLGTLVAVHEALTRNGRAVCRCGVDENQSHADRHPKPEIERTDWSGLAAGRLAHRFRHRQFRTKVIRPTSVQFKGRIRSAKVRKRHQTRHLEVSTTYSRTSRQNHIS